MSSLFTVIFTVYGVWIWYLIHPIMCLLRKIKVTITSKCSRCAMHIKYDTWPNMPRWKVAVNIRNIFRNKDLDVTFSVCLMWQTSSLLLLWQPEPNTLRPRQKCCHFADDISKCIFLSGNGQISLEISLKFVPKVGINIIPAWVQIMAWCRPGDKPLSGPMMVSLLTLICVTRPQWVER